MPESDHLTLLHVYQQWKTNGYRADWCNQHFLQVCGWAGACWVGGFQGCWLAARSHIQALAGSAAARCLPTRRRRRLLPPPAPAAQHKGLKKAKEVRTQLLDIMQQHKVPMISAGTDWDTVRKVGG